MWWGIGIIVAYIIFAIALTILLISLFMIAKTMGINNDDWKDLVPWHL
jgi:hypothetical protein